LKVQLGKTLLPIENHQSNTVIVKIPEGAITNRICVKNAYGEDLGPEFRVTKTTLIPEITGFEPRMGPPGTEITIHGKNFSLRLAEDLVMLGDRQVVVRTASPIQLRVIVPNDAKTGLFSVRIGSSGIAQSQDSFFVTEATEITEFLPRRGTPGTKVTIKGRGFSSMIDDNRVYLNTLYVPVLRATNTELIVEIPKNSVTGPFLLDVRGAGRFQTEVPFTIQHMPTLIGFSPTKGLPGTVVMLRGTNFGTESEGIEVLLGQTPQKIVSADQTKLRVSISEQASSGKFSVTVFGAGPVISSKDFTVLTPPLISGFKPTRGKEGTVVTIVGSGFSPNTKHNRVMLGKRRLDVLSASSTQLRARVVSGSTAPLEVFIRGVGGVRSQESFTVLYPPRVTGFVPKQGPVGTKITIQGNGFGTDPSQVQVSMGGQLLEVLNVQNNKIVVRISSAMTSNRLIVSIPEQGSSVTESSFQVLIPQPEKGREE